MGKTNMLKNCCIFVDMDGTLVTWKPAKSLENLLERGYFRNMPPYETVVSAIKTLIGWGANVFVLSAYMEQNPYSVDEKNEWLDEFIPEIEKDKRIFCPCGTSKWDATARYLGGDLRPRYLLDDYSLNLHDWTACGGQGIKLMNGINGSKGTWRGNKVTRFQSPSDLAKEIATLISYNLA